MDPELIQTIRAFNRYYTAWLDVLNRGYLETVLSWAEARVLFEIHLFPEITATELCGHLSMDKSYVSRLLSTFEKRGFLTRELIPGSKGVKKIRLTRQGEREAARIDENGSRQIRDKLSGMDEDTCRRLCQAMVFIETALREQDQKQKEEEEFL